MNSRDHKAIDTFFRDKANRAIMWVGGPLALLTLVVGAVALYGRTAGSQEAAIRALSSEAESTGRRVEQTVVRVGALEKGLAKLDIVADDVSEIKSLLYQIAADRIASGWQATPAACPSNSVASVPSRQPAGGQAR